MAAYGSNRVTTPVSKVNLSEVSLRNQVNSVSYVLTGNSCYTVSNLENSRSDSELRVGICPSVSPYSLSSFSVALKKSVWS